MEEPQEKKPKAGGWTMVPWRAARWVYFAALAAAIGLWILPIRSALDLDETGSYWQICAGAAQIWHRQFLFPSCLGYSYLLWFWTKIFGTSEVALRAPSVLAMLGAVYLLYRAAREMFDREDALFAAIVFALHPTIQFAAIDIRPYAFGALAINAAILVLIRLRSDDSNRLAALFGLIAAGILWFQYLFAILLPFFVLCFFVLKRHEQRTAWRQCGAALATFAIAVAPIVPGWLFLFRTRATHIFDTAPKISTLGATFAPGWMLPLFLCFFPLALLVSAFLARGREPQRPVEGWQVFLCAALGPVPVLILYAVSVMTPVHLFATRYCLVATAGIALCWALLLERFRSGAMKALFCAALTGLAIVSCVHGPFFMQHDVPWKYALQAAGKNASADNAPVVFCSGFIESDFLPMPLDAPKTSFLFAPLSYYPLSVPVTPMPKNLNGEAMRVGSQFLEQANEKHERFLVLAHFGSYDVLDWMEQRAAAEFSFREIWVADGFRIVEFRPRAEAAQKSGRAPDS